MSRPILTELLAQVPLQHRATHPLTALVAADDHVGSRRASRTEQAFSRVRQLFQDYATAKEGSLVTEGDPNNASGTLGEIRALAELSYVFVDRIQTPTSGSDFLIMIGDRQLRVEVTTPAGSIKNTGLDLGTSNAGNVRVHATAIAPFGYPTEDKPQDTIQGNAVSRLASLKQRERQADQSVPSILWIDLENNRAFPLSIGASQAQPFVGGQRELTSGALWWMNYGRKGDPIFDKWELVIPERRSYLLEFDGRFTRGSRFVGTMCAIDEEHVFHQNYLVWSPLASDWIVELLQLRGAHIENWWIDWPSPGSLAAKVALARFDAHAMLTSRYPAEEPIGEDDAVAPET